MTSGEVDARIREAAADDEKALARARAEGKDAGMPAGTLLAAVVYAGKDTSGQFCPVFALRLRSSGGRDISDAVKTLMGSWDDSRA